MKTKPKEVKKSCENCGYEDTLKTRCAQCIRLGLYSRWKPKPESREVVVEIAHTFDNCVDIIEDYLLKELIPKGETRKARIIVENI